MVEFGPIQFLALGFPEIEKLQGELLKEIFRLSDAKIIRVVGLLAIAKDEKGKVASIQLTDLSDADRIKLSAAIGALIGFGAGGYEGAEKGLKAGAERAASKEFGLSKKDVMKIAESVPNGSAAGLLLIEHLWAKRFKEIAMKMDGVVLGQGFIQPAALVELGAEMAEGAKVADKFRITHSR